MSLSDVVNTAEDLNNIEGARQSDNTIWSSRLSVIARKKIIKKKRRSWGFSFYRFREPRESSGEQSACARRSRRLPARASSPPSAPSAAVVWAIWWWRRRIETEVGMCFSCIRPFWFTRSIRFLVSLSNPAKSQPFNTQQRRSSTARTKGLPGLWPIWGRLKL